MYVTPEVRDSIYDDREERAAEECECAREALMVADAASKQAIANAGAGRGDVAALWAEIARGAAHAALAHSTAALAQRPVSQVGERARRYADLAQAHAHTAGQATERD